MLNQTNPFHEGYLARCNGQESTDNPYNLSIDVDLYFDWLDTFK